MRRVSHCMHWTVVVFLALDLFKGASADASPEGGFLVRAPLHERRRISAAAVAAAGCRLLNDAICHSACHIAIPFMVAKDTGKHRKCTSNKQPIQCGGARMTEDWLGCRLDVEWTTY
jgi:hypothetical protein